MPFKWDFRRPKVFDMEVSEKNEPWNIGIISSCSIPGFQIKSKTYQRVIVLAQISLTGFFEMFLE